MPMLNARLQHLRRLFFLNFYGGVLGLIGIAFGIVSAWPIFQNHGASPRWLSLVLCLLFLWQAARNLANYPHRRRIFLTLKHRNLHEFHLGCFEEFVDEPCHRMVIRLVLLETGNSGRYRDILKAFYVVPWKRHQLRYQITIFESPQEARQWLEKNQKSRIL